MFTYTIMPKITKNLPYMNWKLLETVQAFAMAHYGSVLKKWLYPATVNTVHLTLIKYHHVSNKTLTLAACPTRQNSTSTNVHQVPLHIVLHMHDTNLSAGY